MVSVLHRKYVVPQAQMYITSRVQKLFTFRLHVVDRCPQMRIIHTTRSRHAFPLALLNPLAQIGGRYAWLRLSPEARSYVLNQGFPVTLVFAAIFGGFFYVTHLETVPGSGRRRLMAVSREYEIEVGEKATKDLREVYRGTLLPPQDPRSQRCGRITWQLVHRMDPNLAASDGYMLQHDWIVHVIDSKTLNAFVLPGGKIFVFTGIMDFLDTDDQLAAVLGHEMAHVLARHTAEKLSWEYYLTAFQLAVTGIFVMLVPIDWQLNTYFDRAALALNAQIANMLISLPNSRANETEADFIGQKLSGHACFNLHAPASVWEKFEKDAGKNGDRAKEFLSTHPSHSTRAENLRKWEPNTQRLQEDCMDFARRLRDGLKPTSPNENEHNHSRVLLYRPQSSQSCPSAPHALKGRVKGLVAQEALESSKESENVTLEEYVPSDDPEMTAFLKRCEAGGHISVKS